MITHLAKTLFALLCLAFVGLGSVWFMETCDTVKLTCDKEKLQKQTATSLITNVLKKIK